VRDTHATHHSCGNIGDEVEGRERKKRDSRKRPKKRGEVMRRKSK